MTTTPAELAALYQERLLGEYRAPKNRRILADTTGRGERSNPLCGDTICVMVREADGCLADVSFSGQGCSLAVASASLLTQTVVGLWPSEALKMVGTVEALLGGPTPPAALPRLLAPLRAVVPFPGRHPCVLMPWWSLREALLGKEPRR